MTDPSAAAVSRPLDPAHLATLEALLARHGARPVHRLGQNFLVDASLRDAVALACGAGGDDEVLEIGAGPGALTVALARTARRVVALELDPRLVQVLGEVTAGMPAVTVVHGDALRQDLSEHLAPGQIVAGNIPYYLTGALVPRLLESGLRPRRVCLVVQREVALRWTTPGDWSLGSLAVQVFAVPSLRLHLPREAFWPVPAVASALVVLELRSQPAIALADAPGFFQMAGALFQFRRKQLGGSLQRIFPDIPVRERLSSLHIDPERRPQSLTLAEWSVLYDSFRSVAAAQGVSPAAIRIRSGRASSPGRRSVTDAGSGRQ